MARHQWMRSLALAFTFLALCAPPVWAQKDKNKGGDQNPMDRQRNVKKEAPNAFKKWLEEDVAYIITDEEKKAYKKLVTNEEREQFIEAFWRRRDPNPDTDENEYLQEHFERVAYANQHFASGVPGWKTDRGRIYIMFGPPHEKETHPAGGQYDRPTYHGGGQTSTYPFEVWFYRYLPGVGSGIEIEFVDPTGTGEYRIARSPDEKDAMLHVPGAGLTLSEQLGLSSKTDRITNLGGFGYNGPNARHSDGPFERLQLMADLQRAPQVNAVLENSLVLTDTGKVGEDGIDFSYKVDFFRQSDERVITALTLQTENNDLAFKDVGGVQEARLNIYGRVTAVSGRRVTTFEDPVTTQATVADLASKRAMKSVYQKALPLPPGTYKVDVLVRDLTSGAQQVKHIGFTVPKYDPKQLSTSTMVLAAKLQNLNDQLPGMFTIGQYKVVPNVAGVYRRGEDVGIYMQVYNAGIDQTTLRPSVDVEYTLIKDGKEVFKQAEDWRGLSDAGQRLTLARLLPTAGLAPGEYEMAIRIRDRVSGQSLAPTTRFTLVAEK
ncbi:MAG TPA: GWxTD domain-containing protein [Pyrinomonadaceae bacterium]|jgi:GWxTD domain-containing protein|nr:GWxTD domain-containing protein [Pyrinomonadaceae bacterium]